MVAVMTPLTAHLIARIQKNGPLRISHFMEEALGHPDFGYYMTRDPFGMGGDFTTSPEISQVFGELIGAWCAAQWIAMDSPASLHLVELGPGRGTLMADALRATRAAPGFHDALNVHLIENSPRLRTRQAKTLSKNWPTEQVQWWRDPSQIPAGPVLFIANEFFDALPIRQFSRTDQGWSERRIGLGNVANGEPLAFEWGAPKADPPACIPTPLCDVAIGDLIEVSPVAQRIAYTISARLAVQGGAGLFIDYGHKASGAGDTLQAVKDHAYCGVLETPGEADLTAHVDFQSLGTAVTSGGAQVFPTVLQGEFLQRLGLNARVEALVQRASPEQAADVLQATHRLTAPAAMGSLFKVMAIAGPDDPIPPGFNVS